MKNNHVWLIFFLAVVVIAAFLFLHRRSQRPIEPKLTNSAPLQTNRTINGILVSNAVVSPQIGSAGSATISTNPGSKFDFLKQPEMIRKYNETHNISIEFFGLVIDQNSNPVPDVTIHVTIGQLHANPSAPLWTEGKEIPTEAETDKDGRFVIQDMKGSSLHIDSVLKTGYRISPKTKSLYVYASSIEPFHSDSHNPIIIRVWKLGESAQLTSQDKDTRIPYDGTPVAFDLLTGQKSAGNSMNGDLRVSLIRKPMNITNGYKQAFEWHAIIEAINGGLVQSEDEFMYEAPETGYQPRIQIDMPADTNKWAKIYDISFYAKTRGGQVYSRVKLEFRVDSPKPQTGFTITSVANPNGSRNLQP